MPRASQYRCLDGPDRVLEIRIVRDLDQNPDLSYLEDPSRYTGGSPPNRAKNLDQGRERLRAYRNGEWHCLGIWAEADILVNNVIQTVRSGGLWGTESDSEQAYLDSIAREEFDALRAILGKMGIRRIPAFKTARRLVRD